MDPGFVAKSSCLSALSLALSADSEIDLLFGLVIQIEPICRWVPTKTEHGLGMIRHIPQKSGHNLGSILPPWTDIGRAGPCGSKKRSDMRPLRYKLNHKHVIIPYSIKIYMMGTMSRVSPMAYPTGLVNPWISRYTVKILDMAPRIKSRDSEARLLIHYLISWVDFLRMKG